MSQEPIRLTILKELAAQIEQRADLQGAVFRGRTFFGPASGGPLKMVSIFEDGANATDYPQQTRDGHTGVVQLPLILMGYDVEDPVNPTDPAMVMMYRVIDALRAVKREGTGREGQRNVLGMGRVVDNIRVGNGHVYPAWANELTSVAFFQLPVTIDYVEQ